MSPIKQHTKHTHNTDSLHHHTHTLNIHTTQHTNTENNTDNTHDKNYTFGQELTTKPQQTTRLIYTNINGIKEYPNEFSILNIIDMMEETETDILMLSEINIPWDNITTQTVFDYQLPTRNRTKEQIQQHTQNTKEMIYV